jgi:hypothetical protein
MKSSQNNNERPKQVCQFSVLSLGLLCILLTATQLLQSSTAFSTSSMQQQTLKNRWTSHLHAAPSIQDDEITRQLVRARELIAKTKAKMEAQEEADANGTTTGAAAANVPFFASQDRKSNSKKDKVIKTQNEEGLFTTDGDLMAEMSESEEWEVRPLNEVFQTEKEIIRKTNKLANRDMSAGIQGLQRVLQTEDYLKIFDKRNRFIGEN